MGAVGVAIPAWNEAESIGAVVREILTGPFPVAEVVVADGGSTDGTAEVAARAGARVVAPGPGYGRACLAAALALAGCEVVVFMDGDGADDPGHIPDLAGPVLAGHQDFVVGSRVRGRRAQGAMAWHQVLAGRLAGLAMARLYGAAYTDMCAFRAIRRERLLALGMREMTYGWNLEMQMRAARAGLRVLEVPVDGRLRIGGASKVAGTLRGSVRAGGQIAATMLRVARDGSAVEPARDHGGRTG